MSEVKYLVGEFTIITQPASMVPKNRSITGYGSKIPTRFLVRKFGVAPSLPDKRLRRVYAICYGNAASFYILIRGERYFIRGLS